MFIIISLPRVLTLSENIFYFLLKATLKALNPNQIQMKTETNILLFKIIFCVYYFWWLLSCFTTRLDCLIILAFTILKWNNLKKKKKVCGNNVLYFFSYSYWKSYISNFDQLGVTEIKYRVQLGSMVINNGKMYKPCKR